MPVRSATDMLAAAPADLFAGIDAISPSGDQTVDDTPLEVDDAPDETPAEAPVEDSPADDAAPIEAADDAPTSEVMDPAAPEAAVDNEELPEGTIKTKDAKGKFKYSLDENRYKTVYGNHQAVQQATEVLGEPFTVDALKLRNDGYLANERLYTVLESGDPVEQGAAVKFMLDEMRSAHEAGEVGHDPTIPFAETVYTTLRDNSPDAYANLRLMAARDLVGEMFDNAARSNNGQLFSSAQHFAATLVGVGPKPANWTPEQYVAHVREVTARSGIPFFVPGEMQGLAKGEDPLVASNRRVRELEAQVNGRSQAGAAEQYDTWFKTHVQDVNNSVFSDAVEPALAAVKDGWKDFPDDYRRLVVDPLNREVTKIVRADPALDRTVNELLGRARRATSEQVRQQLGAQIKQAYLNRAKLAMEAVKQPILTTASKTLKGLSEQTHDRRNGAQSRTVPKGPSAPVKQSAVPATVGFKNGVYDPGIAMKQAQQLLAGMR